MDETANSSRVQFLEDSSQNVRDVASYALTAGDQLLQQQQKFLAAPDGATKPDAPDTSTTPDTPSPSGTPSTPSPSDTPGTPSPSKRRKTKKHKHRHKGSSHTSKITPIVEDEVTDFQSQTADSQKQGAVTADEATAVITPPTQRQHQGDSQPSGQGVQCTATSPQAVPPAVGLPQQQQDAESRDQNSADSPPVAGLRSLGVDDRPEADDTVSPLESSFSREAGSFKRKNRRRSSLLDLSLHQCARDGDTEAVGDLLKLSTDCDVNKRDEEGFCPLHYAARYNHVATVRFLLDKGADINIKGKDDITPLHWAARYRQEGQKLTTPGEPGHVMSLMIAEGADVNARDVYGRCPLHFAATCGNELACRLLLRHKDIDIQATNVQQATPLHLATAHNQVEIVHMLIASGANIRCCDEEMFTPFHHACAEGNLDLVKTFLRAARKSSEGLVAVSMMLADVNTEGSTGLHLAVNNGNYDIVKYCVDKGADVNAPQRFGVRPLHLAAAAGHVKIAQYLLDNDADINAVSHDRSTPLHKAVSHNQTNCVRFLVERGARMSCRDRDNYTPFLLAVKHGHMETVEYLLRQGADYLAVYKSDKTAVYLAAEENRVNLLQKLLSHQGVRGLIKVKSQSGHSPLGVASEKGYLGVVKCLLEHGAGLDKERKETPRALHLAAKCGHTSVVLEVIKHDKTVLNKKDEDSNTALHLAAMFGHDKMAELLLERGADVSVRNSLSYTPLAMAACKGWVRACRVLLNHGAPVSPADGNMTTPLHLASMYGHAKVVELLLQRGADIALTDENGLNCLDHAIDNNQFDVGMTIIRSDNWEKVLRSSRLDPKSGRLDTPIRRLIKKMPELGKHVFDRCMTTSSTPGSQSVKVTFNYEFLDDTYASWMHGDSCQTLKDPQLLAGVKPYTSDSTIRKTNHPLYIMVSYKRKELLSHPLVKSLLDLKWKTFGRFFYYLSFIFYFIFLVFLTGYIVQTMPPQDFNRTDRQMIEHGSCENLSRTYDPGFFTSIGAFFIITMAIVNLLKEVFQMFQSKLAYFSMTNLIEWTTNTTAILLVLDFNLCQRKTGYRRTWQWQLGAVSIYLGWVSLLLFVQKLPQLGIYVVMFTDILKTFSRFFSVFFLFIVAFALAFYALLQQQGPFENVPKSLVKTSVMMVGEFDFDEIFHSQNQVDYPVVSYLIFVVFMIIMSILIMNLLVGLAVDDIKMVQEQAALTRKAMQVELALDVERLTPNFIRRQLHIQHMTVRQGEETRNLVFRAMGNMMGFSSSEPNILDNHNQEPDVSQRLQELRTDVRKLKQTVQDMEESSQQIKSMLRAILASNKIQWQEEHGVGQH